MKLRLIWVRIYTAFNILFSKKHWFVVWLSEEDLIKSFKNELDTINITACKLHRFNIKSVMRSVGSGLDLDDLALDKATFEAEAELLKHSKIH